MVEDDRGRRKKTNRYGLGPRAPPANLPFPVGANLTAYELLTFLPNVVHCADVIYRFVSNGVTRHTIWVIVNTARDLPDEWHANCCGTYMYKAMKAAGYDGWTVTMHDNWHAARKPTWDEADMNVGGFRTPNEVRGLQALTESIPFASLAADVRRMPQGNDALDLTRMVQHCIQNPEEQWLYPRDYQRLLKHIGGPAPISREHLDRETFGRWETKSAPPPRDWTAQEIEAATHLKETMKKRKRESSARLATPDPGRHSRQSTPAHTQRKSKRQMRRNTRLDEIEIDALEWEYKVSLPQVETYMRSPADHVKPPSDVEVPEDVAVALAFTTEGAVGEKDAFSAYAFGGPRPGKPYRMLHHIGQPHPADISGWAENLRWAFEQRACFWYAVETEGWNESPSHMKLITTARQTQNWASDELLENLPEVEDDHIKFPEVEE